LKLKHELKVISFRGLWLASSASTDGCCERVVVCRTRKYLSALTRDGNTLRKQTILVRLAA